MTVSMESLPKTGRLEVDIKVTADINISAYAARQKVDGFVLSEISYMMHTVEPTLILGDRTGELHYWDYSTDHTLVVIGYDDANIYVNDPNCIQAHITVSQGDFELAWLQRDYYYALIT